MNTKRLLLSSILILGATAPLSIQPAAQSANNVNVILVGSGDTKQIKATGLIRAPIQKVWKTLTDYGNYPRFMPKTATSKIHSRKGNAAIVTMKLDLPFPFKGTWYTNKYTEIPSRYYYEWSMLKGSIKSNSGSWQLIKKGNFTHGTYRVQTNPGVPLIPQWIIDTATKNTIPSIFTAVEKRANAL